MRRPGRDRLQVPDAERSASVQPQGALGDRPRRYELWPSTERRTCSPPNVWSQSSSGEPSIPRRGEHPAHLRQLVLGEPVAGDDDALLDHGRLQLQDGTGAAFA